MTEQDWLTCDNPLVLLEFLRGRASERKLRLFAVACSRRIWDRIDAYGQAAVEMAEVFADGNASAEELRAVRLACKSAGQTASWYAALSDPFIAARNAALSAQSGGEAEKEQAAQAGLMREIFGNPFHPSAAVSLSGELLALATRIYEDRDFDKTPALAAALTAPEEIVQHLATPGAHVRGCWALDLLLGKK
jgi:hypothetical protein